ARYEPQDPSLTPGAVDADLSASHSRRRGGPVIRPRLAAMLRRLLTALVLIASTMATAPLHSSAEPADEYLPLILVHGFMGSGQQFESQALRLVSNGHPADLIEMFEHDSLAWPDSQDQVWEGLDALIDQVLAESGADAVNLIGHSQGTGVLQGYLGDPSRA